MAASEQADDRLPSGHVLAYLPALGTTKRNPSFWSDVEVRRLVIATHRQMTVQEALAHITAAVGPQRTPSKSALARVWKRLDRAVAASGIRPAGRSR